MENAAERGKKMGEKRTWQVDTVGWTFCSFLFFLAKKKFCVEKFVLKKVLKDEAAPF